MQNKNPTEQKTTPTALSLLLLGFIHDNRMAFIKSGELKQLFKCAHQTASETVDICGNYIIPRFSCQEQSCSVRPDSRDRKGWRVTRNWPHPSRKACTDRRANRAYAYLHRCFLRNAAVRFFCCYARRWKDANPVERLKRSPPAQHPLCRGTLVWDAMEVGITAGAGCTP